MPKKLRPLSGLDASFLYLEAMGTPMHVGSLMQLEVPAGPKGQAVDFRATLVEHLRRRLPKAPALRRVLEQTPLDLAHPMWREQAAIDLDHHITRQRLPRGGTPAQLRNLVAKLHAEPLPRDRPLWQFVVIDGLADGSVALYSKVHHALLDGQGGIALAQALLDLDARGRGHDQPIPELENSAEARTSDVLKVALKSTLSQFGKLFRAIPATVKVAAAAVRSTEGSLLGRIRDSVSLAPRTPFNVQVGPRRSYATLSLPLPELKQLAKALGVSLNDIVMALCAGALRDWLIKQGKLPKKPLVAAMPISLRAAGDTEINNQASMAQCELATDRATPLERLRAIHAATRSIKDKVAHLRSLIPTDYPGLAAPIWMSGLSRLWARGRIAERLPPLANVAISNVPGPPFDVYLAGARLRHYWPVSIITHGIALNITVQSYGPWMEFGIVACHDVIARLDPLIKSIERELKALAECAKDQTQR